MRVILRRYTLLPICVLVALAALAPRGGFAQSNGVALIDMPPATAYDSCMARARGAPALGFQAALAWSDAGGGPPARHCVAVALNAMGYRLEAATRLTALAAEMAEAYPAAVRARVLSQASRAWVLAERNGRARASIDAALRLTPDDPELLVIRAEILAADQDYWSALDALNRALDLRPRFVDALVFRATTYRFLDALPLAEDDLARALALAPRHPDALVERGIVRRLEGDADGARRDWERIVALAPDDPAAGVAQANLALLDGK